MLASGLFAKAAAARIRDGQMKMLHALLELRVNLLLVYGRGGIPQLTQEGRWRLDKWRAGGRGVDQNGGIQPPRTSYGQYLLRSALDAAWKVCMQHPSQRCLHKDARSMSGMPPPLRRF